MRRTFILIVSALAVSCKPAPQKVDAQPTQTRVTQQSTDDGDPATASQAEFEARGLKWALTKPAGTLGCSAEARWIEIDGIRYGLNGTASEARGYAPLEPIWSIDSKMAADLKAAGLPNDPPLRVSIGDLIAEAGKLC